MRLALSKDALKMKGIPRGRVISAMPPAVSSTRLSFSIAQGPAMRKCRLPARTFKEEKSKGVIPLKLLDALEKLKAKRAR